MDEFWLPPPATLALSANEVHAWRVSLEQPGERIARWRATLSEDELVRAGRYRLEIHRNQFIVARGVLRELLGLYLLREPGTLRFHYNEYGKPDLLANTNEEGSSLRFNLSHSLRLALYAFARERAVGIDVEYMGLPGIDYEQLARHNFSPSERVALAELSQEEKRQGFYNCWTRKEAYIKARGMGLSIPLDTFDVSLRPAEPPRLLASRDYPPAVNNWKLLALSPGDEYAGALLAEGTGWKLRCWEYE